MDFLNKFFPIIIGIFFITRDLHLNTQVNYDYGYSFFIPCI